MSVEKYRKWSFVLYPEDDLAGENAYLSWLSSRHVPILCIFHTGEDGDKDHVHVLVDYGTVKTRQQVINDFSHLHVPSSGSPEFFSPVRSTKGLQRYFLHLDDSDKKKYPATDLRCLCGYQLDDPDSVDATATPLYRLVKSATQFVTFEDFVDYVVEFEPELLSTMAARAYFLKQLFGFH